MADRYVRRIGEVFGTDERAVTVGVDYDTVSVRVGGMEARLSSSQADKFFQLFVSACWQAAAHWGNVQGQLEAEAAAGGEP